MIGPPFAWCPHVVIFVCWVSCCSSEASWTPAEVTKYTYEVMDDFENLNHGNRVQWACSGGGGRLVGPPFAWCPHVVVFVRWVGCYSSEASRTPAEVNKPTYEVMDDVENSNHGNRVRWACPGGGGRMARAQFAWCRHGPIIPPPPPAYAHLTLFPWFGFSKSSITPYVCLVTSAGVRLASELQQPTQRTNITTWGHQANQALAILPPPPAHAHLTLFP